MSSSYPVPDDPPHRGSATGHEDAAERVPQDIAQLWACIVDDLTRLGQADVGRRFRIQAPDFEDLRQSMVSGLLRRLREDAELRGRFAEQAVRRAFLRTMLQNCAHRLVRRQENRSRVSGMHLPTAAAGHESSPEDTAERRELVSKLERQLAPSSHAMLALRMLTNAVTLSAYAEEHEVSERTARRHFVNGICELRRLLDAP